MIMERLRDRKKTFPLELADPPAVIDVGDFHHGLRDILAPTMLTRRKLGSGTGSYRSNEDLLNLLERQSAVVIQIELLKRLPLHNKRTSENHQ